MEIYNIDLHYHAGQERQPGLTLKDYIQYAKTTGRKILGITDHIGLYMPDSSSKKVVLYERSINGLLQYRQEIEELKDEYPDITMYFAPEINPAYDLNSMSEKVIEISDFFIFELPNVREEDSIISNTENMIKRMYEMNEFCNNTGKEAYIAHPFRSSVNIKLVKKEIEPWITEMKPGITKIDLHSDEIKKEENYYGFSIEEINSFFMFDVVEFGATAVKLNLSVEINGNTQQRIRASNLPAPLQMLWGAFKIMKEMGVDFVPGSDQHGFINMVNNNRMGGYVPWDCFVALGITLEDIKFITKLKGYKII
ncbi:MAG TPA: hypothetical protein GXX37_06080 [Clostridiaceae bacterium]|nr:hypothetical protein [Clostridiaceae bacterium]